MRTLQISSQSTIEPVNSSDVFSHLRIQTTLETALIDGYITASRKTCENKIKRALVPTSFTMRIDEFEDEIALPRPPLSSTAGDLVITYINSTNGTSTCDSTRYRVDYESEPAKIYLAHDSEWPTDIDSTQGAVIIKYKSGYTTATIPENIKLWLKMRVGAYYENREPIYEGPNIRYIRKDYIDSLLDEYYIPQDFGDT